MRLYLIRHAQSENNARPEHERVEDPGLTELGARQIDHLVAAELLPGLSTDLLDRISRGEKPARARLQIGESGRYTFAFE